MTVSSLLSRCPVNISNHERALWFRGAALQGSVLTVPTADQAGTIQRCYLPILKLVMPDLTVRVQAAPIKPVAVKRHIYTGKLAHPTPQDLLDS